MSYLNLTRIVGFLINLLALFSRKAAGKVAFTIFCTPKEGKKFTEKEERFLRQAEKLRLPFKETQLQIYRWNGSGKSVLLAHGYESNTARWRPLIRLLNQADFTVIALDAPAHGASGGKTINGVLYAEAMATVLEAHPVDFVVGHSLGGMSAIYYFSHLESIAVEKLILMAVPAELSTIMEFFYDALGLNKNTKRGMATYFQQYIGFEISYFSAVQFIKQISLPGLLILDKKDEIALLEDAKKISDYWQNGQLLITDNLGHSLQGRKVFRAILEALQN